MNWESERTVWRRRVILSTNKPIDADEPEWVMEQAKASKRKELLRHREEIETRLRKIRANEKAQREKYLRGNTGAKRRKTEHSSVEDGDDGDQFLLEDYESESEAGNPVSRGAAAIGYSVETLALMSKLGMTNAGSKEEEEEVEDQIKVSSINILDGISDFL